MFEHVRLDHGPQNATERFVGHRVTPWKTKKTSTGQSRVVISAQNLDLSVFAIVGNHGFYLTKKTPLDACADQAQARREVRPAWRLECSVKLRLMNNQCIKF